MCSSIELIENIQEKAKELKSKGINKEEIILYILKGKVDKYTTINDIWPKKKIENIVNNI